jgi:hypothetical protein
MTPEEAVAAYDAAEAAEDAAEADVRAGEVGSGQHNATRYTA